MDSGPPIRCVSAAVFHRLVVGSLNEHWLPKGCLGGRLSTAKIGSTHGACLAGTIGQRRRAGGSSTAGLSDPSLASPEYSGQAGRRQLIDRHCEPTGRREAPPDDKLREAIQLCETIKEARLLRRTLLAMTLRDDIKRHTFALSPRDAPEVCS